MGSKLRGITVGVVALVGCGEAVPAGPTDAALPVVDVRSDSSAVGESGPESGTFDGSSACAPGGKTCDGLVPLTCESTRTWRRGAPCAFGCTAGVCGLCDEGTRDCDGNASIVCENGAWAHTPCSDVCSSGNCVSACSPGSIQCAGLLMQVCTPEGVWDTVQKCAYLCQSPGVCVGECAPGAMQCDADGRVPQACSRTGAWVSGDSCSGTCKSGLCLDSCAPGETQCSGRNKLRCEGAAGWAVAATCDAVCASGNCTGVCQPDQKRCASDGRTLESCDESGAWQAVRTCEPCERGSCEPSTVVMSCTFRQNPSVRRELATFDGKIAWDITTGVISSTLAYAVYYDHNTASTRYVRYDPTQPGAAATSGRLFDSLPANDLSREPGMLYVPTVSAKPGERSLLLYPLGEAIGSPSVVGTLTDGSRVSQATFARTPGGTLTYAARVAAASGESYSGTIFESAGAPATTGSTFAENLTKTVAFSGTMMFGGSRYVSHRNNPGVHDPHRMYKMPATLPFSAGAASSRVVGPSNTMTLTAQPAANGVDWLLAVLTFDLTGADIRVARVHAGNVDTWTTGDAPAGYATSNVAEFPFGSWTWHRHGGDDFLMLIGSGVNASGLNIVALDSSGRVVVRSTGAAGALLSGLRIDNAAIAAMPDFSTASPRYLLQWAVQDQLTHKTTIYSDVLHCDVQ